MRHLPLLDDHCFRVLLEHSAGIIKLLTREGTILYTSRAITRVMGYGEKESVGHNIRDYLHPEDLERCLQIVQEIPRTSGQYMTADYRCRHADGSYRWLRGTVTNLLDDPCVNALVLNEHDITDQKEAERKLQELFGHEQCARVDAEQRSRSKDQFMGIVSHELRNPLTPVLLYASDIERDSNLPEKTREEGGTIRQQVELEVRLIDDLLDLTRFSQGKLDLRLQTVDVHSIIHNVLNIYRDVIQQKPLGLTLDLQAARHHLHADPARMKQIFWNLLGNAVKFTPAGGSITITTRDVHPESVQVQVSDTGIGVPPELLEKMFQPFEQEAGGLSKRLGGLGLGLTICRALVDLHGGHIRAKSAGKGQGATFEVVLPSFQAPVTAHPVTSIALPRAASPAKILLVEDDLPTQQSLARLLRRAGYQIFTAGTVAEAVEWSKNESLDLVICDIGLPDGNGWDLMRELRKSKPIVGVALSGYGMGEDEEQSQRAGFAAHLIKPIDVQKLEATIEQLHPT
jgi:PAS domain S-box-containing protein